MDQRRLIAFCLLSFVILVAWDRWVMPRFLPKRPPGAPPVAVKDQEQAKPREQRGQNDAEANHAVAETPADKPPAQKPAGGADPALAEPQELAEAAPAFPHKLVVLGSLDPQTGFRQQVTLTSAGAAIEAIELADPRYRELAKPHPPLRVVGAGQPQSRSLEMQIPQISADLRKLHWELVEEPRDQGAPRESATFRIVLGQAEVVKKFSVARMAAGNVSEADAYNVKLELTFRNLAERPRTLNYQLLGPTGLVLENLENTSKYRDVVVGFLSAPDAVEHQLMSGATIADGQAEEWRKQIQYIGVDAQYFAALLLPVDDPWQSSHIASMRQLVVGPNRKERSDVTVELTSADLELAAAGDAAGKDLASHTFKLFAGPKRDDILPPHAGGVIDFGSIFGIGRGLLSATARLLMQLLAAFQSVVGNWGVAIIMLTVLVRGAMVPISIKMARNAARMQELAPQLAALKEKFGNDSQKLMRAQMELYQKNNIRPFRSGCLPVLCQMPIFMGLYQALNHAVDLRLAPFLWFENLAAPDALFQLPFRIPLLGWSEFNLLPMVTVGLFLVQQKLFSPPPANEEQAMQQKVFTIMTVMMGLMFYKVPAGLCVYFIASSLWGIAEKQLLPKSKPAAQPAAAVEPTARAPQRTTSRPVEPPRDGFWASLLKAAEKDAAARRTNGRKRR
jgi:YidC/Oxa1 family membrane protein insertase